MDISDLVVGVHNFIVRNGGFVIDIRNFILGQHLACTVSRSDQTCKIDSGYEDSPFVPVTSFRRGWREDREGVNNIPGIFRNLQYVIVFGSWVNLCSFPID